MVLDKGEVLWTSKLDIVQTSRSLEEGLKPKFDMQVGVKAMEEDLIRG